MLGLGIKKEQAENVADEAEWVPSVENNKQAHRVSWACHALVIIRRSLTGQNWLEEIACT